MPPSPPPPTAAPAPLGAAQAAGFGRLIRDRRQGRHMTQDDLALATGVGRRFIIDLEAGKPTSQLGKALLVAEAVGLRLFDPLANDRSDSPLLPDIPSDDEGAAP